VPLELVPVPSAKGDLPFAFNISMGVKKGDDALKARVDKVRRERSAEIAAILKQYGVPLMDTGRTDAK
jgi:mxaJ protein